MTIWQIMLMDLGRVGIGLIFTLTTVTDLKARRALFQLMRQKKVPLPWLFFLGGVSWKAITGILLIVDYFTAYAALLLALYIFIANVIFNNFWAVPKEQRDFSFYLFLMYLSVSCGLLVLAGASL
jgi:putative oxidoreductase